MINNKIVTAIIPARGGSKSVPHKNIHLLAGKPLIEWTIEVALQTATIDHVVVSTDDIEIAKLAETLGAKVVHRPAELATDEALVIDAVRYSLKYLQEEHIHTDIGILLEPTCPLRSSTDIQASLSLLVSEEPGYDSVATFTEAELNPHRAWVIDDGTPRPFIPGTIPWKPRQLLPEAFQLNGAVYAFFADKLPEESISFLFGRAGAVQMPPERSVDVDTLMDFKIVEAILLCQDPT